MLVYVGLRNVEYFPDFDGGKGIDDSKHDINILYFMNVTVSRILGNNTGACGAILVRRRCFYFDLANYPSSDDFLFSSADGPLSPRPLRFHRQVPEVQVSALNESSSMSQSSQHENSIMAQLAVTGSSYLRFFGSSATEAANAKKAK